MNKNTKILVICNKGNVRSVATKHALNQRGYKDVLTMGSTLVSQSTASLLAAWADIILLAKSSHGSCIPIEKYYKVKGDFKLGDDKYGDPTNWVLTETVNKQLDAIGLI